MEAFTGDEVRLREGGGRDEQREHFGGPFGEIGNRHSGMEEEGGAYRCRPVLCGGAHDDGEHPVNTHPQPVCIAAFAAPGTVLRRQEEEDSARRAIQEQSW